MSHLRYLTYLMVLLITIVIEFGVFLLEGYDIQVTKNSYDQGKETSCPMASNWSAMKTNDIIQAGDAFLRYVHPYKSIVAEKKFSFNRKDIETARKVIDDLVLAYKRKPVVLDCGVASLPKLMLVTAVSSNHFLELTANIIPAERILPHEKLVVYDLGLKQQQIDELRSLPYVEYRQFNFSRFPDHVKILHTYAFKPLIVAETLAEFGGVMWMDSSISFYQNYSSNEVLMRRMIKRNSGFLFYVGNARHSIAFATHGQMLDYLPIQGEKESMTQAGGMILFNTAHVLKHIMKWAVLCSLSQDCIAPREAKKKCDFSQAHFAGICHRYDQSMFSILVSNAYNNEPSRYRLKPKLYPANLHRGRRPGKKRAKVKRTLSNRGKNQVRSLTT